ncbi:MAG: InlB B-repeat-containing protein [Treponema sp.]|nr:InlB B-repeat-containing protein [Treponema sp.]
MKKSCIFAIVTVLLVSALFVSCSNGSDSPSVAGTPVAPTTDGTTTGTENGDGQTTTPTQTPEPIPATYTITFNANDETENPATATQTFTEGEAQALKTFAELGFAKEGFSFAGWLIAIDATEASYADGASFSATGNVTLYAKWSAVPVYSVNIPVNEHGTVTASPATAAAGAEITLSNIPKAGYKFNSYIVTAIDGSTVTVTNGKFIMPEKNVTVTAMFNALNYTITCGNCDNGSVTSNVSNATIGTQVTLTASPTSGYELITLVVKDTGGVSINVSGSGNKRYFKMPAKNVTVTASFAAINYTIACGNCEHGSVTVSPQIASVGTSITLSISPENGYEFGMLTVTADNGLPVTTSGTGNTRTFKMPAQNVTVNVTFNAVEKLIAFGMWPQTIKASNVFVSEVSSSKKVVGMLTYYQGGDGGWYVRVKENANGNNVKYSDGTSVAQSSANSYKWFKVEPIKWQVLTTNYNGKNKKLLFSEKNLAICTCIDEVGNRHESGKTDIIYANNYKYSKIRAWLNGWSYYFEMSPGNVPRTDYSFENKGFLQTAFTTEEQANITKMKIINDARSTNYDDNATKWNNGENQYACADTYDYVFLLSVQELTKSEYGFKDGSTNDTFRERVSTDYAKACGANGHCWTRSPSYDDYRDVHYFSRRASSEGGCYREGYGVAPALCIDN